MPTYKVTRKNNMTMIVEVHLKKSEKSFDIFFSPDHHWDNPKCERELLKSHLDECLAKNASIIMPGDTFCLMQGAYDPRKNKSDIRPEHNHANYLDRVINTAVEWYAPYRNNIHCLGQGNHESSILKRQETNVLERFCERSGIDVEMGYQGWVIYRVFTEGIASLRAVYKVYFNHGSGGDAPVTYGMIEHNRMNVNIEGADLLVLGHNHNRYTQEIMTHYYDQTAQCPKIKSVLNVRASTYKQEYTASGFHLEKGGRKPKPLGGTFVTLHLKRDSKDSWLLAAEPRFHATPTLSIAH